MSPSHARLSAMTTPYCPPISVAELSQLPLFRGIRPEVLVGLLTASRMVRVGKGKPVAWVGDPASELFVVLSGSIKRALLSASGQERVTAIIGAGEPCGEAECFSRQSYSCALTALEPSTLLAIDILSLRQHMRDEPALGMRLLEIMAERQFALDGDIASSFFQSGPERVLDYLLRLARPYQGCRSGDKGDVCFVLPANKQTIASRIGITPETLSRSLRDLHEAGLLDVARRHIHLHMQAIADYARRHQGCVQAMVRLGALPPRELAPAARPLGLHAVNVSGMQRMLTQRMARAWLMRGAGVMPEQAEACLTESIAVFERQLQELGDIAHAGHASATHGDLVSTWAPYKKLLQMPPARKAASSLLAAGEQVLHSAHVLTLRVQQATGSPLAQHVNLAGRQRMLAQKLAKLYMSQYWGGVRTGVRHEMEFAREEFSAALHLLGSAREAPLAARELGQVRECWRLLEPELTARPGGASPQSAHAVVKLSDEIVDAVNAALSCYQSRAA